MKFLIPFFILSIISIIKLTKTLKPKNHPLDYLDAIAIVDVEYFRAIFNHDEERAKILHDVLQTLIRFYEEHIHG